MGTLLSWFYFAVGLLCMFSVFVSFYFGQYVLSSWLFLAIFVNFFLFQVVRKEEQMRKKNSL
ncbi:hypothetical protein [Fervidibacillus albus]|uniref:Uncharacterized protein n=1 Tax=Fervidibacillus albus TaxID=2980026 RepID=A0A9E8RUC5_9BACI|nr:hypothetical protein [Fervidibacillus albus]WAA09345.1 hypothetical protein OE104_12360 [Fervidibacillus albus]